MKLRSVQTSGFQEQWDFRLKAQTGKTADDSFRPNANSAILPGNVVKEIMRNPSILISSDLLPQLIHSKLVSFPSVTLKKIGRILTNRRHLTINDLLLKMEENLIEYTSDTFYTIGVLATEC
jgi:hypothetical protein